MNFCPNCGFKLPENVNNCPNCGHQVKKEENMTQKFVSNNMNNNLNNNNQKSNGIALAGFILSIVSTTLCCGMFSWLSLILSIIGLSEAKKYNNDKKKLAIAGIIISLVWLIIWFIIMVCGYSSSVFDTVKETVPIGESI